MMVLFACVCVCVCVCLQQGQGRVVTLLQTGWGEIEAEGKKIKERLCKGKEGGMLWVGEAVHKDREDAEKGEKELVLHTLYLVVY